MKVIKKIKYFLRGQIPGRDMHGFEYTVKELIGMWENSHTTTQKWHGKILNNEIIKYKNSDTIFILGSGPSINDMVEEQWNFISNHDSIGFNWWFIHDFVPKLYMFQGANDNMLNLLEEKHKLYKNTPFIIRGSAFARGEFDFDDPRINLLKNNPVYFLNEYPIHSECALDPKLLYKYMDALGFMTHGTISNFIPKWRGTLGLLIMLSYQMGYKNIVLCGMDMHKPDHFWDYPPYNKLHQKYNLPKKGDSNILSFTNTTISPNTVPLYIYTLHEWMQKHNNVKIYIANENTILYPKIKLYDF